MGALRFILAASVMIGHFAFYPHMTFHPLAGDTAVEGFYIVSGFLITLVLMEKYRGNFVLFYTNRALRIFPLYWVCLALYIVANWVVLRGYLPSPTVGSLNFQYSSATWWVSQHGESLSIREVLAMVFANVAIFGQDVLTFFNQDGSTSVSSPDLFYHSFIFVRVAWTVAIELSFYVIAPFVVFRITTVF